VKCEPGEPVCFGSKGWLAGVAWLTRALGSSGEPGRPSCSAVQHNLDAMIMKNCDERGRGGAKFRDGVMEC
jgi:hypothetical protein